MFKAKITDPLKMRGKGLRLTKEVDIFLLWVIIEISIDSQWDINKKRSVGNATSISTTQSDFCKSFFSTST